MSIDTFWEGFALTVTSLFAIRETIAKNVEIPKKILPEKWRWLLYNKKDEKPVLCRRTYNIEQEFNTETSTQTISEQLIKLAGRRIRYFPDGIYHGRPEKPVISNYFIDTISAASNEDDLHIMTNAIHKLIANQKLASKVDFVLYLQNGNPILACNIYKNHPDTICICRHDKYKLMKPVSSVEQNIANYGNLDVLLQQGNMVEGPLTGIAVDCSVSTGAGLRDAIEDFNKKIAGKSSKIAAIEHAFVLYGHQELDDSKFPFKLHRYFDMPEEIRKSIWNTDKSDNDWYKKILNEMKEKGLLKEQPE